jgi:curved DNA-binding protein CbpA
MKGHYRVLGFAIDGSQGKTKKAFRSPALRYHPDHNPQNRKELEEAFKETYGAYQVPANKARKQHHDYLAALSQLAKRNMVRDVHGDAFAPIFSDEEALQQLLRQIACLCLDFGIIRIPECRRGYGRSCQSW